MTKGAQTCSTGDGGRRELAVGNIYGRMPGGCGAHISRLSSNQVARVNPTQFWHYATLTGYVLRPGSIATGEGLVDIDWILELSHHVSGVYNSRDLLRR